VNLKPPVSLAKVKAANAEARAVDDVTTILLVNLAKTMKPPILLKKRLKLLRIRTCNFVDLSVEKARAVDDETAPQKLMVKRVNLNPLVSLAKVKTVSAQARAVDAETAPLVNLWLKVRLVNPKPPVSLAKVKTANTQARDVDDVTTIPVNLATIKTQLRLLQKQLKLLKKTMLNFVDYSVDVEKARAVGDETAPQKNHLLTVKRVSLNPLVSLARVKTANAEARAVVAKTAPLVNHWLKVRLVSLKPPVSLVKAKTANVEARAVDDVTTILVNLVTIKTQLKLLKKTMLNFVDYFVDMEKVRAVDDETAPQKNHLLMVKRVSLATGKTVSAQGRAVDAETAPLVNHWPKVRLVRQKLLVNHVKVTIALDVDAERDEAVTKTRENLVLTVLPVNHAKVLTALDVDAEKVEDVDDVNEDAVTKTHPSQRMCQKPQKKPKRL